MTTRLLLTSVLGLALATTAAAQDQPGRPAAGQNAPGGARPNARQADPSRIVDRLMQADADGDGRLSKDEMGETRFAAVFDQADADGDGFLTAEEVTTFMASRGPRAGRGGEGGPEGRPARGPQGGPGGPQDAAPAGPSKEAFHEAMERAGRALRGLRRTQFEADTFDRDFTALLELEASLMEARRHVAAVPMSDAAKERFGADQAAYRKSFQLHLAKAMMATLQVEVACLEGESAKAKELVAGILENRNTSHELFEQE